MRLSEFDPVVTATAVPRCVLSFKVSSNRRDKLHGGKGVDVNCNGRRGGANLGILSSRVRSTNQKHNAHLFIPTRESSLRGYSTVSLGWASIVFDKNSFYLDCVGTVLNIRANLADKTCT